MYEYITITTFIDIHSTEAAKPYSSYLTSKYTHTKPSLHALQSTDIYPVKSKPYKHTS